MTKVMSDPNCLASGTTRSVMRSMCENASSAPSRCMACAMPQAMERSVARPTINARLPLKKPMSLSLLPARIDIHDQPSPGLDLVALIQAVPTLQLRHGHLKLLRDAVNGVAAAYGIQDPAAGYRPFVAIAARAGLDHQALAFHQGVLGVQVI